MHLMTIIIIFCAALFSGCTAVEGTASGVLPKRNYNSSKSVTQVKQDWKPLIERSNLVVTGNVAEISYVVDETKMHEKTTLPDVQVAKGENIIVPLPNLRESVKGVLVQLKITEVIHIEKSLKIDTTVDVYVADGYLPPTDTDVPIFIKGEQYLVFLSELEQLEKTRDLKVIQPLDLSRGSSNFNPESTFKVIDNRGAYIFLTESNQHIILDLKSFLRRVK